jgi:uncharacterized membrane protein
MASSGSERSGLLTAGGILSIVGGAFEVGMWVVSVMSNVIENWVGSLLPSGQFGIEFIPTWLPIAYLVLGIIAIVGGVSSLRRKSFGLSLAGAICCALPSPSSIFGILAVIFVALRKREFGAERKENGI